MNRILKRNISNFYSDAPTDCGGLEKSVLMDDLLQGNLNELALLSFVRASSVSV